MKPMFVLYVASYLCSMTSADLQQDHLQIAIVNYGIQFIDKYNGVFDFQQAFPQAGKLRSLIQL